MNKIEKIDRSVAKELRVKITENLNALLNQYGVVVELGNIKFADDHLKAPLTLTVGDSAEDVEQSNFEKDCWKVGLDKEDYGKTFTFAGKKFKLIGIQPNRRKYPILCKDAKGKKVLLPNEAKASIKEVQ